MRRNARGVVRLFDEGGVTPGRRRVRAQGETNTMIRRRTRSRTVADLLLTGGFMVLICLPATRTTFGPPSDTVGSEYRQLASCPAFELDRTSLGAYPAQFEAFFSDRFGFRTDLIRWLSVVKMRGLGISSSPKVILGKKGWLFCAELPGGMDYTIARPLTREELNRWQHLLEARRDWLAARGIRYLFVPAPDKQTVYPEDLPRPLRRQHQAGSRLDQLLAHLRAHSDVPVLDLREPLRQAKARERLFDVTDTHWNSRGAFVGYRRIVETLSPWFPQLHPLPREAFEDVAVLKKGGDLARMLDLDDQMPEESLGLVLKHPRPVVPALAGIQVPLEPPAFAMEQADPRLPRAVMFCDSFTTQMFPLLGQHFQRLVIVWHQNYPTFHADYLERERPDVVIQEVVERKIGLAIPDNQDQRFGDPLCGTPEPWYLCEHGWH
jgi:alginate O-acetyltransferase complex protein AlgJ